jgi:KDO2-lipid IV(A) lauroyltransferase
LHRLPTLALRLIARLPLRLLHALGSVLGWAIYGISPTYRRHLRENLAQAGLDDARVRRAAITSAGKMLLEVPAIWFRRREAVLALVKRAEGLEAMHASRAAGKALLFLTPHMGCFEIAAQYATRYFPITVLYRRPKAAWLEPLMRAGRERERVRLVPADLSGVRELYAALKRREAVGFLPDQVPGKGEGEWSQFFGRPAYTMTLVGRLSEQTGAPVLMCYSRRLPRGRGYRFEIEPLLAARPPESRVRTLNRSLEDLIRRCPEQYLWSYNRYKVPAGVRPPAG